jgi:hypothetical protein
MVEVLLIFPFYMFPIDFPLQILHCIPNTHKKSNHQSITIYKKDTNFSLLLIFCVWYTLKRKVKRKHIKDKYEEDLNHNILYFKIFNYCYSI